MFDFAFHLMSLKIYEANYFPEASFTLGVLIRHVERPVHSWYAICLWYTVDHIRIKSEKDSSKHPLPAEQKVLLGQNSCLILKQSHTDKLKSSRLINLHIVMKIFRTADGVIPP